MQAHELKPPTGSRHARRRVGCGIGSGHGKTSGRGHKGQKARSGGAVRTGFEGGQTPLYRRLPRRGFNNYEFADVFDIINVGSLDVFNPQDDVNVATLKRKKLVRGTRGAKLKILGDGELRIALKVHAHKFSASARAKIEKAGGECIVLGGEREAAPAKKAAPVEPAEAPAEDAAPAETVAPDAPAEAPAESDDSKADA
jgi:large subunit ribosomal protein L15